MHKAPRPQGSVLQPDGAALTRRPPTAQSTGSSIVPCVPERQSLAWHRTTAPVTQGQLGECDTAVPPPPERHALFHPHLIPYSYVDWDFLCQRGWALGRHQNLNQAVTTTIHTLLVTKRTQPILLTFPVRMLPATLVF